MAKRVIFAETTPLGHQVVLKRDRWREIVRFKHPALAQHRTAFVSAFAIPTLSVQAPKTPRCIFTIVSRRLAICAWSWEAISRDNDL